MLDMNVSHKRYRNHMPLIRRILPIVASTLIAVLLMIWSGTSVAAQNVLYADTTHFLRASPEAVGLSGNTVDSLSMRLERWVQEDDLVGIEVLLVKDGRIVFHKTSGWSDREQGVPIGKNSLYHIASMTKPFTGTAILMLADEGLLDLDQPVSVWLESWDNARSRDITVRQLLTHTGGWANEGPGPTGLEEVPNLAALGDSVGVRGPMYPPGEIYRYGDAHSYALGAIVEEVSGMTASRFISSRILGPLGLDDTFTYFDAGASWSEAVNPAYRLTNGTWEIFWRPEMGPRMPFFFGAGGMYSTARDYARFLDAWMDWLGQGEPRYPRLLSRETAQSAVETGNKHLGYGLHWYVYGLDPLVFGHGGADGTRAYAVPSEDLILIFMSQSRGTRARLEWPDALESLVPGMRLRGGFPVVSIQNLNEPVALLHEDDIIRYAGEYVTDSDTVRITDERGKLRLVTSFWLPYDLIPLGDGVFAMGIYENGEFVNLVGPDARIRFIESDGRIESFRFVVLPEERIDFEAVRIIRNHELDKFRHE